MAVGMVILPVTITVVVNQANGNQKVQYFAGTYTVQNNLITNTTIAEGSAPASSDDTDPAGLIANYFAEKTLSNLVRLIPCGTTMQQIAKCRMQHL
jgi:hypothetical protein